MIDREEILKYNNEKVNDGKPDEMESYQVLRMARVFGICTSVIILITLFANCIFHNTNAVIENAWIGFTSIGIASFYLDKKQGKRKRMIADGVMIGLGLFFFIGYIGMMMR